MRKSQYLEEHGLSEIPILPEDIKLLLEQIKKLCGKISVAKVNLFIS